MKHSDFEEHLRYVQLDYGRQPTFSSFLPGIAGPWGVPAWCNYNNRGQAVCSFGVQDKDHAILEFTAAQAAYQRSPFTGFRTFLKENGQVTEPFVDGRGAMTVEPNVLSIRWRNSRFSEDVTYFTLPNAPLAGLCRKVCLTNLSEEAASLELLDGLATVVPYGVSDEKLKQEPQLSTAWMQIELPQPALPCFCVRASMEDSATVTKVSGMNFRIGMTGEGTPLGAIVQPSLVFGWDTSLKTPQHFISTPLASLLQQPQLTCNFLPCCFTPWHGILRPQERVVLWEFFGQAESVAQLQAFSSQAQTAAYFEEKLQQARELVRTICAPAVCHTADPVFDGYVAQSFLDNALRGGLPYHPDPAQKGPPVYLYSRKHGDPEREYNSFFLSREYFSQGNANFRDICQNRRSDVWFDPAAGAYDLQLFFELLQPDGYNPLVVQPAMYVWPEGTELPTSIPPEFRQEAAELLDAPFSAGQLAACAIRWQPENPAALLSQVICATTLEPMAEHQQGYWSDHWTYLLDLLENQLAIFPEQARELLFGSPHYRWFSGCAEVLPQAQRYCLTENGLRQYHYLAQKDAAGKWIKTSGGETVRSTLAEKLLLLCAVKSATLDLSGAAVEMEGGKPGWCDAMNGLPGLLGASVAEGCELLRLLDFLLERSSLFPQELTLHREIAFLLQEVCSLTLRQAPPFETWLARNRLRDQYRAMTRSGFSGEQVHLSASEITEKLHTLEQALRTSIERVTAENNGICPTYFYYEADGTVQTPDGILPSGLKQVALPLFLEGPTRWLHTRQPLSQKKAVVKALRDSALYDRPLRMYKLNAPLDRVSCEVGRIRAFAPGWLENESVWLHMEYKYFLSLLRCRFYEEFFEAFSAAAIPFLSPVQYGRSTMENVSFLVSSANCDRQSHGRGFVSRLSGSTAELLSVWNHMAFGAQPFRLDAGKLVLEFQPVIPANLLPASGELAATFLGNIVVVYHTDGLKELLPGTYQIHTYRLLRKDGSTVSVRGQRVPDPWAEKIRAADVCRIDVFAAPSLPDNTKEVHPWS